MNPEAGAFVEDLAMKGVNPVSPFGVDKGVEIVDCIDTGVSGTLGGLVVAFMDTGVSGCCGEGVVAFMDTGVSGCCGGGVVLAGGVPHRHLPQGGGVVFVRR